MKKVFIDLGAHNGCSVRQFYDNWEDASEYEVHSFEPDPGRFSQLKETFKELKVKGLAYKAAAHVSNDRRFFDGWMLSNIVKKGGVPCLDISSIIKENWTADDYIVLKFDIEGVEYDLIDKMDKDGTLAMINKVYGEVHGPKKGYSIAQNNKLLDTLEKHGLKCGQWDALEGEFQECYIVKIGTPGSVETHSTPRTGVNYLYA